MEKVKELTELENAEQRVQYQQWQLDLALAHRAMVEKREAEKASNAKGVK